MSDTNPINFTEHGWSQIATFFFWAKHAVSELEPCSCTITFSVYTCALNNTCILNYSLWAIICQFIRRNALLDCSSAEEQNNVECFLLSFLKEQHHCTLVAVGGQPIGWVPFWDLKIDRACLRAFNAAVM